jgi:4-amino-4-deoxychorismate lyase
MTLSVLINGTVPADLNHALPLNDRGFQYGDGLFETALLHQGAIRFLEGHLERLCAGCQRLNIRVPDLAQLRAEIARVTANLRLGVLKVILTRGAGSRGYRPLSGQAPTRIVALYPAPELHPDRVIQLRWCSTRLGRNARLAGIKHLNRLEQVLAQSEWNDAHVEEGLMLDTEGELIGGTASNVFIVRDGALLTPDLRYCGVRGVMRSQVLRAAFELNLTVSEEPLWPRDLEAAEEVFVTNAVQGVRTVAALESLRWQRSSVANALKEKLQL